MNRLIVALLTSLFFIAGPAYADGGCPPGEMPNNAWASTGSNESVASCIPMPDSGPTKPQWETRWGAIASQKQGSEFGIVIGKKTERQATKASIGECVKRGGTACESLLTFRNQCAAVVSSKTQSFAQGAPYEADAIAAGQKLCRESNSGECWVYFSGCSLPERAR